MYKRKNNLSSVYYLRLSIQYYRNGVSSKYIYADDIQIINGSLFPGFAYKPILDICNQTIQDDLYVRGNVGIGTTDPGSKLVVSSGETGPVDLLIEADTSGQGSESYQSSLTLSQDGGGVQGKLGFFNSENDLTLKNIYSKGSLHLGTNNSKKVTIDKGGNVGIGTTDPYYKLSVSDTSGGLVNQAVFGQDKQNGYSQICIGEKDDSDKSFNIGFNHDDKYGYMQIAGDSVGTALVVANGGKVGINDTTPSHKLDVNGDINSNGRIRMYGTPVLNNQQAHIADANGTLSDITAKFNTLLSELESHGLLSTS